MKSFTVAVKPPNAGTIKLIADAFATDWCPISYDLEFGYAKVHPKENYCKKTGREEAEKRMKTHKMKVKKVELTDKHIFIVFDERIDNEFQVLLRLNKRTGYATICCYDIASY